MSLNQDTRDQIHAVLEAARTNDGVAPFSEQYLLGLSDERLGHQHFVHSENGQVGAIIALDGASAELVVAPNFRRRGIGEALLADAARSLDAGSSLQVWAHGNLPAAQAFAQAQGLSVVRRLLVMAVEGEALRAAATVPSAEGFEVLNYEESVARWSADAVDAAWVTANNEAFSWHPEQGGWDVARLRRGREAEWFDEKDVILFWDTSTNVTGVTNGGSDNTPSLAGFHWTKWHTEDVGDGGEAFGEVYVVGLANVYRGRGLGTPLLHAGLHRMVKKGARRVILYVESDNEPAVRAYENLGFGVAEEHAVYQRQ